MKKNPFISLANSLVLLRYSVAFIFLAHATIRVTDGTVERFGGFLNSKGFVYGTSIVWMITAYELIGGVLLALGYFTKWLSAGFMGIILMGIVIIHAEKGWFVGEHGDGGSEYSFILVMALIVIAAAGKNAAIAEK
ncbi:DoxX family protein [Pedobacter sp. PAMC26386]|nr:DoxX family protein [Pedobacter sp. PAMC26386]